MVSFEFPEELFPVCHYKEDEKFRIDAPHHVRYHTEFGQRPNTVEYGRLSAVLPCSTNNGLLYRISKRSNISIIYDTSCLPLTSPNIMTPYDQGFDLKYYRKTKFKEHLDHVFRYFKQTYYHTYVPVKTLMQEITMNQSLDEDTMEFQPNQSTMMAHIPRWSSGDGVPVEGYLVYAAGPNCTNITVAMVVNNCKNISRQSPCSDGETSYTNYNNSLGKVALSTLEILQLPGRVKQITSESVNKQVMVAVRCNYHIVLFELVKVFQSSDITSSIAICPYYYGEGVFVTDNGGLYLWDIESGVTAVQEPISERASSSKSLHYWQCVYGYHPRCIVLTEHNCISCIEFADEVKHKIILDHESRYLQSKWVVTSIARHPINPFHLFVATSETILLIDLRQPSEPLLEIRHEVPSAIRYMGVVCCPWEQDVLLMVSSLRIAYFHVYVIGGGYSIKGNKVMPPYLAMMPHAVDTYREFHDSLNIPSMYLYWRLHQASAGAIIVPLGSSHHYCGLMLSCVGDLFYQCWHYGDRTPHSKVPYPPQYCTKWVEEILQQDKAISRLQHGTSAKNCPNRIDMSVLLDYLQSPLSEKKLCVMCHAMVREGGPYHGIVDTSTIDSMPRCDGTVTKWACHLCGQLVHSNAYANEMPKKVYTERLDPVSSWPEGTSGLEALRHRCGDDGTTCPSDYEEVCRLWALWEEHFKDENDKDQEDENSQTQNSQTQDLQIQDSQTQDSQSQDSQIQSSQTPNSKIQSLQLQNEKLQSSVKKPKSTPSKRKKGF